MNPLKFRVFAALAICFFQAVAVACAQSAPAENLIKQLAGQGIPLTVNSNVTDSTSVEAVLIPPRVARHVFGVETGKNYLVIELLVANHNPQASLIIESVFLDYTEWLPPQTANSDNCIAGKPVLADTGPAQRTNCPKQIASAEYRMVRAELLDRQPFTTRNLIVNGATALGSIGTAFMFPFSRDVVSGINAWNGGVVPALAAAYPDPTINQLNHISDLGFQTNKVIPKQSSDVVVAFFPIDRILTSSLKTIYLKDPAVFFVPGELELEKKYSKHLSSLIQASYPGFQPSQYLQLHSACGDLDKKQKAISREVDPGEKKKLEDASVVLNQTCEVSEFLNSIALTRIHVGIGGDMTVSTQTIPPTITAVNFVEPVNSDFWLKPATHTGTILGTYLTGGTPAIVDKNGKAIPNVTITPLSDGATESQLPFSMVIAKCIDADTEIYFKVTRGASTASSSTDQQGSKSQEQVTSMLFDYGRVTHAESCPADASTPAAKSAPTPPSEKPADKKPPLGNKQ